jgi:hypothetical protein
MKHHDTDMKCHKRLEVFMAVKMLIVIFCVVTPHSLVDGYQHLRGTYNLRLEGRCEQR